MYSEEEKKTLMKELKEMESLKVDTGSEGEILQNDIIDFITEGNGDKYDLISRIELFTYAFKLFSRKEVTLSDNQFIVYLNDSILDYEKIELIKKDFNKFEFYISLLNFKNFSCIVGSNAINSFYIFILNFSYFFNCLDYICRFISLFFCHG